MPLPTSGTTCHLTCRGPSPHGCCATPCPAPERHASRPDVRVEEQPARWGFHLTTARFDVVLLQHVAMNISDRARLYREIRRVLKSGGRFATYDVVLNSGAPHYPVPWARTPATSFLLTAAATREAIEPAGFCAFAWQDDTEAAKAWIAQLRASGPPPSPNRGVVMGPDFAQLSADLGRNLMEGGIGIPTAVFEAA